MAEERPQIAGDAGDRMSPDEDEHSESAPPIFSGGTSNGLGSAAAASAGQETLSPDPSTPGSAAPVSPEGSGAAASKGPRRSFPSVGSLIYDPEYATVRVGEEDCNVDLTACAPQAAFFMAIREKRRKANAVNGEPAQADSSPNPPGVDCQLADFPGGIELLRDVVRYLQVTAAEERAAAAAAGEMGVPAGVLKVDPGAFHLELNTDNIGNYLEAAALLRCPRLLRDTVLAPAAKELSSRRVLTLLERVILYTADTSPGTAEALSFMPMADEQEDSQKDLPGQDEAWSDTADSANQEQVVQAFSQVIQRLCARLDAVDFKLTATLAAGSPWATLEVLRAFRVKVENVGRVNYALQSVTSTVKSLFVSEPEKGVQQLKHEWKEHHFALHVFRKHIIEATLFSKNSNLRASAELAMLEQENEVTISDDEGEAPGSPGHRKPQASGDDDIPEAICDAVVDSTLIGLAGFVMYCDPAQTPPVLAGTMIRSLLLVSQTARARTLFEAVFVRSRKAQAMVVTGQIPLDFLSSVKIHRAASVVLRRLLAQYQSISRMEVCHLIGNVLLEDFKNEKHCRDIVLSNALIRDIVVYCRVTTRACEASNKTSGDCGADVVPGTSPETELLRLRKVGEKLFAATFVIHNGFLPEQEKSDATSATDTVECPWDSGELDLPLLDQVPLSEDALHLARRVLLRGLFRRQLTSDRNDVPGIARLWALGRWPSCREATLISEAFKFLADCWRDLRARKADVTGASLTLAECQRRLKDEDALFKMFSDLEFWRLPPGDLLTPWVPPQLLACHMANRCKLLDEQQSTLFEDNHSNLEEINRLRQTVMQLSAKLEAVSARSVQSVQKQAEVADTLRTLR